MKKVNIPITFPKDIINGVQYIPIFNKGMLVYEKSGHILTTLKKYYSCAEKQKNKCSNIEEKMLNRENFERKYKRYLDDLKIDKAIGVKIHYNIEKEAADMRARLFNEMSEKRNNMALTLKAMEQDLKHEGKLKARDIDFLKEEFSDILKINYPAFLVFEMQVVLSFLTSIDHNNYGPGFENVIETMTEKIYISDSGKITKIKLEGLGDLLFQYLENKIPSCMNKFKIPIIDRIKFPSMNLEEVMKYFKENNFRNVFSYGPFSSDYSEQEHIKRIFQGVKDFKPKEIISLGYFLKDYLWQDLTIYCTYIIFKSIHKRTDLNCSK